MSEAYTSAINTWVLWEEQMQLLEEIYQNGEVSWGRFYSLMGTASYERALAISNAIFDDTLCLTPSHSGVKLVKRYDPVTSVVDTTVTTTADLLQGKWLQAWDHKLFEYVHEREGCILTTQELRNATWLEWSQMNKSIGRINKVNIADSFDVFRFESLKKGYYIFWSELSRSQARRSIRDNPFHARLLFKQWSKVLDLYDRLVSHAWWTITLSVNEMWYLPEIKKTLSDVWVSERPVNIVKSHASPDRSEYTYAIPWEWLAVALLQNEDTEEHRLLSYFQQRRWEIVQWVELEDFTKSNVTVQNINKKLEGEKIESLRKGIYVYWTERERDEVREKIKHDVLYTKLLFQSWSDLREIFDLICRYWVLWARGHDLRFYSDVPKKKYDINKVLTDFEVWKNISMNGYWNYEYSTLDSSKAIPELHRTEKGDYFFGFPDDYELFSKKVLLEHMREEEENARIQAEEEKRKKEELMRNGDIFKISEEVLEESCFSSAIFGFDNYSVDGVQLTHDEFLLCVILYPGKETRTLSIAERWWDVDEIKETFLQDWVKDVNITSMIEDINNKIKWGYVRIEEEDDMYSVDVSDVYQFYGLEEAIMRKYEREGISFENHSIQNIQFSKNYFHFLCILLLLDGTEVSNDIITKSIWSDISYTELEEARKIINSKLSNHWRFFIRTNRLTESFSIREYQFPSS